MTEADEPTESPLVPPTVPDGEQVAPAVAAALGALVEDVVTLPTSAELAARLETLIDLLITRGHLAPGHRRLLQRLRGVAPSVVRLSVVQDKRAVPSADIDCASFLHLCKGRCCAMRVSLSEEDLAERRLEWDLQQPYLLRRDPDHGYCSYLGHGGRCAVYDDRPATCRQYDCRDDPRVWIDWERKLPAPLPWNLVPEAWLPDDDEDQGGGGDGPTTSAG
jgi:Fe-S-cluster containining protein